MLNLNSLRSLLGLRYRLLWAQTRSRNGKIAIFLSGYLFAAMVIALLSMGGFSAALVAVRSGQAELVARIVLSGFFFNALAAALALGFGMNSVFSEDVLRRFPLSALDRLAARQLTALLEPLWFLVLAVDLGLAFGLYALGACDFFPAVIAALLLMVVNYLSARVLVNIVERLMQKPWGPAVLLTVLISVSMLPGMLAPLLVRNKALASKLADSLRFTPPFAAATVMSSSNLVSALYQLFTLLSWAAVLLLLVFYFERRPVVTRTIAKARAGWDSPVDRFAMRFGAVYGPLVGKVLRYYMRSTRARYNLLLTLPMVGFLVRSAQPQGKRFDPASAMAVDMGAFAIIGLISTAVIMVNQFGYDEGGFRRYFLLPISPAAAFRASSLITITLGATLIPPAILVWLVLASLPATPLNLLLLISSAVFGVALFNALGLWTTLFSPRRADFSQSFGNNLSGGGNVVVIGGALSVMLLPQWMRATHRAGLVYEYWWVAPVAAMLAIAFYLYTLRTGAGLFVARREHLLGIMEGRD